MSDWNPIVDGSTTLNAAGLNPIFNALANQIAALAGTTENNVVLCDATNCTGLTRGTLVAYTGSAFVAAQPNWGIDSATGRVVPAAESYVVGMLYEDPDISGNARILVSGVIRDPALIPAGATGPYYLNSNGTLQYTAPDGVLPVFCGYKTQADVFIFRPAAPEYTGHRHTEYTLSGGVYTNNTYDFTSDSLCAAIVNATPANSIIGVANKQVTGISISGSVLTFTDIPSTTVVSSGARIFATNSLVTTDAEVRAVAPADGNDTLQVTKAFGTVYIDNEYPNTFGTGSGICVTDVSKKGVTTAPVVNQLAGAGDIVVTGNNGSYEISNITSGAYLDFQTINANNVLVGATSEDALLTFPENVAASVVGIVRLPPRQSGAWTCKVFAWGSGVNNLIASGGVINPPSSFGGATGASIPFSGNVNTDAECTGSGGALVQVTLSNNSAGVQVTAAGIYIES